MRNLRDLEGESKLGLRGRLRPATTESKVSS
jgi:hypothetical protein